MPVETNLRLLINVTSICTEALTNKYDWQMQIGV